MIDGVRRFLEHVTFACVVLDIGRVTAHVLRIGTIKNVDEIAGGLSTPSKMPEWAYNLSATGCGVGQRLQETSTPQTTSNFAAMRSNSASVTEPDRSAQQTNSAELVYSSESTLALNCTPRYHSRIGAFQRRTHPSSLLRDRNRSNRQDGDKQHGGSPMQQIPLSQGQSVIVDDQDFPLLADFKWCFRGERNSKSGYAVRHHKVDGRDRLLYLHRQLMNPPDGHEVIFLNFDKLDCRRSNLRVVTKEEARRHHRVRSDSKSGVKGVRHNPDTGTWSAYVYRGDRCLHIGTYYSQERAVAAYEQAMRAENPGLNAAPAVVERPSVECVQRAEEKSVERGN